MITIDEIQIILYNGIRKKIKKEEQIQKFVEVSDKLADTNLTNDAKIDAFISFTKIFNINNNEYDDAFIFNDNIKKELETTYTGDNKNLLLKTSNNDNYFKSPIIKTYIAYLQEFGYNTITENNFNTLVPVNDKFIDSFKQQLKSIANNPSISNILLFIFKNNFIKYYNRLLQDKTEFKELSFPYNFIKELNDNVEVSKDIIKFIYEQMSEYFSNNTDVKDFLNFFSNYIYQIDNLDSIIDSITSYKTLIEDFGETIIKDNKIMKGSETSATEGEDNEKFKIKTFFNSKNRIHIPDVDTFKYQCEYFYKKLMETISNIDNNNTGNLFEEIASKLLNTKVDIKQNDQIVKKSIIDIILDMASDNGIKILNTTYNNVLIKQDILNSLLLLLSDESKKFINNNPDFITESLLANLKEINLNSTKDDIIKILSNYYNVILKDKKIFKDIFDNFIKLLINNENVLSINNYYQIAYGSLNNNTNTNESELLFYKDYIYKILNEEITDVDKRIENFQNTLGKKSPEELTKYYDEEKRKINQDSSDNQQETQQNNDQETQQHIKQQKDEIDKTVEVLKQNLTSANNNMAKNRKNFEID